jgi:hypothetical protein
MSGAATCLDHVGICARDPRPVWAAYEALGFFLTPVAHQSGRRSPGAPLERLATGNRCAMLQGGYLELLGILEPERYDNGLGAMLDRYEGMHILALGLADAEANLPRLRRAGIDIPGIAWLERPVDDPEGPRARFARLPLPDAPEGRLQLIQHMTPELIWRPDWMRHPNHAAVLESCILVSADPAASAARLSRLAGLPLEPDALGGFALPLPGPYAAGAARAQLRGATGEAAAGGLLRILPPAVLPQLLPGVAPAADPFLAGCMIRTDDGNAAIARLLGDRAVPVPGGLMVPPALAGGAALVFLA